MNAHTSGSDTGFLAGGGGMGERLRAFDWSTHPLGSPDTWPQSLRSALSICLNTAFPIAVYWGPQAILLYNDAWAPILGNKHPWALGRVGSEVWSEIWGVVGPVFDRVVTTGEGSFQTDALLAMHRHGYTEECYFDYTFSPIRGEAGGVEGVFNAVTETTNRVVEKRRLRTLRDLAARPRGVQDVGQTVDRAMSTLAENPVDVPFAMLYVLDEHQSSASLAGATVNVPRQLRPPSHSLDHGDGPGLWPIAEAVRTRGPVTMDAAHISGLPGGYWGEPPTQVVVQPVAAPGQEEPAAALVVGVNPRRALDEEHRTFHSLAASHIGAALADARAYQEEKRRAEALAALDRAKTLFFSNVSHELRTPLTLMLGPLQDALTGDHGALPEKVSAEISVAHRNAQRLLKLVNALLDFSRIEAGRAAASYQPTDLAAFTADLASSFRSAVETVGMRLVVDCPPLPEPVYVDRGMWEKVVLNLLSNAFKYTLKGEIRVTLRAQDGAARLTVADTGVGIPADAMPRLFDRFYRVEGSQGRTHEGTGIGLALVNDLVKLHAGSVTAESEPGRGSAFTVMIPLGVAHLPADAIRTEGAAPTPLHASSYADEALSWIDTDRASALDDDDAAQPAADPAHTPLVLLADDNRDMREYIRRLLTGRCRVVAVADGREALEAIRRQRPDLVLTDVMMPHLDGFGLLAALRADPETSELPVLMLSARAGEESRVEGLSAGADDYLVKPFSARELVARVEAQLKLSHLRREAARALMGSERRFREIIDALPAAVYTTDAQGRITHFNPAAVAFAGRTPRPGADRWCVNWRLYDTNGTPLPHDQWPMARSLADRRPLRGVETVAERQDGARLVFEAYPTPIFDEKGELIGGVNMLVDITERKKVELERAALSDRLAKELADMERLHALGVRLAGLDGLPEVMREVLAAAKELVGADFGSAQLLLRDGRTLELISTIGFDDEFCRRFRRVEDFGFTSCAMALRTRERVLVDDLAHDPRFTELARAAAPYGLRAAMSAPLVGAGGSLLGVFTTYWSRPHRPTDHELRLLDIYVQQAARHVERREAEEALRGSEARFRALVTTTADIVFRMNRDWTEMLRLEGREFITDTPEPSRSWLDRYIHPDDQPLLRATVSDAIRAKGVYELEHRVIRADGTLGWVFSRAVPLLDDAGEVVEWFGAASDITRRREEEDRNQFLVRLDDLLRSLTDAHEITLAAAELLGEHLHADRCGYADVEDDQDTMNLAGNYLRGPGVRSIVGRLRLSDLCSGLVARLREGRACVVDDAETNTPPATPGSRAAQIRAAVWVPLCKQGRLAALMAVHSMSPRRWQAHEIELVELVAARCWESIERARVARTLRESEARLRLAQRAGNVGVFEWNIPEDRIVWSPELEALYGLPPGAFAGGIVAWEHRVEKDDARRVIDGIRACFAEGRTDYAYEFRAILPSGERRWLAGQAQFQYGPDGEPVRMIGVNIDIDHRKRAEEAVRSSEEKFRTFTDTAPAMLWVTDPHGMCTFLSRGWYEFTGQVESEAVGLGWTDAIHPDDRPQAAEAFMTASGGHRVFFSIEYRLRRADGVYRWALDIGRARFNADGSFLGYVGNVLDIHEQKRIADELARHREHLQQMVDERTAELEASHRQLRLSERMAALGTLSAGLGHDMGNLLVPVRVRLESLAKADLPESLREDVEAIRASAEYLRKLSSGLRQLALDPTKSRQGESTELRSWWEESEPMLRNTLPRGVRLKSKLPGEPCWARIARPALAQAVFNLVQNAGDALRERGTGSVTVWAEPADGLVRIGVTDDGPGMTPEVRARCMEPFYTTKTRGLSTGMGLSLVYGLIQDTGGAVAVESDLGKGATFILSIPAGPSPQPAPPQARRTAAVDIRDARLRAIASAELRSLAFDVKPRLEGAAPDLLVLDDSAQIDGALGRTAIVLIGEGRAAEGVIATGPRPTPTVIREVLRRVAGIDQEKPS